MNKKNFTVTSRYIHETTPIGTSHTQSPIWRTPFAGQPIPRLAFGLPSEKMSISADQFASTIESFSQPQAIFFPDTNFFTKRTDRRIWDALLKRRIAITPLVWKELRPWLDNPFHNREIRDVVAKASDAQGPRTKSRDLIPNRPGSSPHERVLILNVDSDFLDYGHNYYFDLLRLRRLVGLELRGKLIGELGEVYTDRAFHAACQREYGERGFRVARDVLQKGDSATFFADEQLVVMAAQTAILAGHETFILTWDTAIQEQYFKLLSLLNGDFAAFAAAWVAAHFFGAIPFKSMPISEAEKANPDSPFAGDEMRGALTSLRSFQANILPKDFTPVCVYCLLMGGSHKDLRVSEFAFCAEKEMSSVLRVKTKTGGRNTEFHGNLNCHVGSHLLSPNNPGVAICLCEDQMTACCSIPVSVLDKSVAIMTHEHTHETRYSSIILP